MALTAKDSRKHEDPGRTGAMVEFYLGYQNGMDRNKNYTIPVKVNGFEYTAVFGRTNILPKAVVEVLKNSKSAIHPSANVAAIDRMRGGEGRPSSELLRQTQTEQYISDYEIVIQKEV